MTIPELFQRQPAREAAMNHYAEAYDCFAERAQMYTAQGVHDVARDVADAAFLFLRAYKAEMRDPKPRQSPVTACCDVCLVYRSLPESAKGPHVLS